MIISKSPFRISFIGGGSDLPSFYEHDYGAVLSGSINKYIYIASHTFFSTDEVRLKYSQTETIKDMNTIQHPIFREVLKKFKISGALEISSNADIPSGSGLGSSSSFTANLLLNMYARHHHLIEKHQLAQEACDIELNKLGEPIGKQDHYATVFGGLNVIKFKSNGDVIVEPLIIKPETKSLLEKRLCLFYTGQQRSASRILAEQQTEMSQSHKRDMVKEMVRLVDVCKKALYQDDLTTFGQCLAENWALKKQLTKRISNSMINTYVDKGIAAGAEGAKLLGAGESGFLLFYCPESKQKALRESLEDLREMPFEFESQGARVIYIGDEEKNI